MCKRREQELRADSLAKQLSGRDQTTFWRSATVGNRANAVRATMVDGCTGDSDIADMWNTCYSKLMNSVPASRIDKPYVNETLDRVLYTYDGSMVVNPSELKSIIAQLDNDKSSGPDDVYAEYYKCASDRLLVLLTMCMTAMFVHNEIPEDMIRVLLVPIVTAKNGDISSSDKYRPFAIAIVFSKSLST
jgi:hypothetical protein